MQVSHRSITRRELKGPNLRWRRKLEVTSEMVIHIALFAWKDAIRSDEILDALETVRQMPNKKIKLSLTFKCPLAFS